LDNVPDIVHTKKLIEEQESILQSVEQKISDNDIMNLYLVNKTYHGFFKPIIKKYKRLEKKLTTAKGLVHELNQRYHPFTIDNVERITFEVNEKLQTNTNNSRWLERALAEMNDLEDFVNFIHGQRTYDNGQVLIDYRQIADDFFDLLRRMRREERNTHYDNRRRSVFN